MDYNNIDSQIWRDKRLKRVSPLGRYLFIYLFTNAYVPLSGIYELDEEVAKAETGLNSHFDELLKENVRKCNIKYDRKSGLIWVINKFKRSSKSEKVLKHVAKQLINLDHPFRQDFVKKYGEYVAAYLPPNLRRT